jgi:hypothetical protein
MSDISLNPNEFASISSLLVKDNISVNIEIPEQISSFMSKLKLLQGVPLNYLVPDERMLPNESIRFFYVDFNWVYSLVDGAYSIGRSTTGDMIFDAHMSENMHNTALLKAQEQRTGNVSNQPLQTLTGFILRSSVVPGWPGIEATAYARDSENELTLLRFEKLSENILIGIFDGIISKLNLHEPPEGMHFGFDKPDRANLEPSDFFKQLKYVKQIDNNKAGEPVQNTKTPVVYRDLSQRVVKTDNFAQTLKSSLINAGVIGNDGLFTVAEFALQMIEGVELVTFKNT